MHLIENIKLLRNDKGLSQESLGILLEKSKKTVSSYEVGQAEPSLELLGKMCKIFQIDLHSLVFSDLSKRKKSENTGLVAEDTPQYNTEKALEMVVKEIYVPVPARCVMGGEGCAFERLAKQKELEAELERLRSEVAELKQLKK